MKVLFVGGSGNISTACSRLAAERGMELVHFNRGQRRVELPSRVRAIHGDVSDRRAMAQALASETFDVVVNWIVFDPAQAAADVEMFAGKIKQYVFISTATVYQKPPRHYVVTEETPLANPFWEYSQKKIATEQFLTEAHRRHGFPVTIVRPSFTYGDTWIPTAFGIDFTSVHRMRKGLPLPLHGDGTSLWVMTHASDFAKGLLGLLGRRDAVGEAFHITSDEVLTWNQVYECIAAAAGTQARLVHIPSDFIAKVDPAIGAGLLGDKAHSLVFDNSKIKRFVPGFNCTVPLAVGIRRTLAWLDAHPEEQRLDSNAAVEKILSAWSASR
ncbi:MAG TPA: SDR family oxidoreductase [Polyangia bacterium]|nr:SDR family oxidoreductase [Polyangia bacterium]